MIAAFDVHYTENAEASAAAVIFNDYGDAAPVAAITHLMHDVADYIPGEFFKRELPCLLKLKGRIHAHLSEMIIDGYVMHRNGPGLGQHLYAAFDGRIPVIGVAKNPYIGSSAVEVLRGRSRRPLWVTSAGIAPTEAAARIERMHGRYRIPTLLRLVDQLARGSRSGVGVVRDHCCSGPGAVGVVSALQMVCEIQTGTPEEHMEVYLEIGLQDTPHRCKSRRVLPRQRRRGCSRRSAGTEPRPAKTIGRGSARP